MEQDVQQGLNREVRYLKGVGEVRAAQLERLGIRTIHELLLTLPRRYEDRRQLCPMNHLASEEWAVVGGQVVRARWARPRYGKGYFEAAISDQTGVVHARWYGATWLQEQLGPGARLVLFGKPMKRKGGFVFDHPEFERVDEDGEESIHLGRIVPVYPLTENLPQRTMRRMMWNAVEQYAASAEEILPAATRERARVGGITEALVQAHFPADLDRARAARARLVFEEFLCMQLVLAARKIQAERFLTGRSLRPEGRLRERFLASLPFELTAGQQQALSEIREDMARARPMHRLLQGDVGSGKTVVAACAVLDAIECGTQAAVMAPTEILAAQHARTLGAYLKPMGVRIGLLTGSLSADERVAARAAVADGRTSLVVGTHALIQDRVAFKDLGLVVIDEQHKFGVEQRGLLYEKGAHPDVLVMTATPIPRTLAMTLYGDLDVTTIREMPGGRQPIVTRVISPKLLDKAYGFIRQQVKKGRQAYLVYPLVSESERLDLKAAREMFERLRAETFRDLRLGLVHGQLAAAEKDRTMERFRRGEVDILVATSVIEVGVDVPNATVMLVEHAERFGLAQLHQLRGRIGRGSHKSFCILQGTPGTREAWQRLKVLEETTDGFRIAEEDFRIRGMGNLLGREQSGAPLLRVGDPLRDVVLLEEARQEAFRLIEADPRLESAAHAGLRRAARALYRSSSAFVKVG